MAKVTKVEDKKGWVRPLRLTERKAHGKYLARLRVKCGCCDEVVEIHHEAGLSPDIQFGTLEINGVHGTKEQWRKILLPLLK